MRTIDADALKELFSEVIGHIAQKPEMNGNLEHMVRASAMVIQMIDDAPSVQLGTNLAEVGTDLVSRQAAKDIFTELYGISAIGSAFDKEEWADICETTANELPSTQLNHNAEVSKMGIVHCEDCEHWDTSWETVYGLHYCPMIDMSTKKNFFCKYGAEKRGEVDETD